MPEESRPEATPAGHRPRIELLMVGGTFDSIGHSRLDLSTYFATGVRLSPDELLASLPELGDVAIVDPIEFRRVSSSALTIGDWLELRRIVAGRLDREDCDGVVLAHGTNTIEETGYFLDLSLASNKPVIMVGAVRPHSALSSDGALNLMRAVQVAASPAARNHGVLVVMNERIFAAADATKTATQWVEAVGAPDAGPLGYIDAGGAVIIDRRRTSRGPRFDLAGLEELPRVDIVVSYVGADGALIEAAVAAGARGIVSAGTGAGRPTPGEEEALTHAVEGGVVVCQSSRVGSGSVVRSPLLESRRVVAGRHLRPWKARVLLSLALTRTSDVADIQGFFDGA